MGFLDKLFGKKPAKAAPTDLTPEPMPATPSTEADEFDDDEIPAANPAPVDGPPELQHAVALQRQYWTYQADEQAQLAARGPEQLSWPEKLRLHHLNCLERLIPGAGREQANARCLQTTQWLLDAASPYRPRLAMVWQGQQDQERDPDQDGLFFNPSLTHLGALEIYRLNADHQPLSIDFIGFDDLCGVMFAPPGIIRLAKLFFENGTSEIVHIPMLYGLSWTHGNEMDRSGRMTRFLAQMMHPEINQHGISGLGIGQQDFVVRPANGAASLFGMGSVSEITFPLDMRDPRFDEKARARGIDPDLARQQAAG